MTLGHHEVHQRIHCSVPFERLLRESLFDRLNMSRSGTVIGMMFQVDSFLVPRYSRMAQSTGMGREMTTKAVATESQVAVSVAPQEIWPSLQTI